MEAEIQSLNLKEIGGRIRALRKGHGLTQGEFSDFVGVDQSSLSRVEQGERPPSAKLIFGIAQRLSEEEVVFLLTGEKPNHIHLVKSDLKEVEAPLNIDILTQVISGVEEGLDREGLQLSPDKKSHLISILYDHYKTKGQLDARTFGSYLALVK